VTQQYDLDARGALIPLPLKIYNLPTHRWILKQSHLFRYIYYQRHLGQIIESRRRSRVGETDSESGSATADEERAWKIIEALLQKLDRLLAEENIPWFLVWQGDVDPGFHVNARRSLERIVAQQSLIYLDLSGDFVKDFANHPRWFRIKGDGHWNEDGHRVAGTSLARFVLANLEEPRSEEAESFEWHDTRSSNSLENP